MNNLFENWSDTASWTSDGSLQYDERNHVLYFDKTKVTEKLSDVNEDYDVAAVRTFEIPDGSFENSVIYSDSIAPEDDVKYTYVCAQY